MKKAKQVENNATLKLVIIRGIKGPLDASVLNINCEISALRKEANKQTKKKIILVLVYVFYF